MRNAGVSANLTVPQLSSFFRDERFPDNWVRRAPPAELVDVATNAGILFVAATMDAPAKTQVIPGRNVNGTFVKDAAIKDIVRMQL